MKISITTCGSAPGGDGCDRTLATFEGSEDEHGLQTSALDEALDWLADMLYCVARENLYGELRELRDACNKSASSRCRGCTPFPLNCDFPLELLNLVLKPFRLRLENPDE